MLAHPFFGRQDHEFFPDLIENSDFIFTIFESEAVCGKMEFLHGAKVTKKSEFSSETNALARIEAYSPQRSEDL